MYNDTLDPDWDDYAEQEWADFDKYDLEAIEDTSEDLCQTV